jgi:hypothetical protein
LKPTGSELEPGLELAREKKVMDVNSVEPGSRSNPTGTMRSQARRLDWDLLGGLHHGQRRIMPRKQAGYMTASDRCDTTPKNPLHRGRPYMIPGSIPPAHAHQEAMSAESATGHGKAHPVAAQACSRTSVTNSDSTKKTTSKTMAPVPMM